MLAERISRISASATLKVLLEAERLRQQGVDVVDFGAGEPDFPTPEPVKDAARRAIDENFTRYTPAAGTRDLQRAIVARYAEDYGVRYSENEVIVTAGGKQALFNVALALVGAGDEVITHAPGWSTIVEQIRLLDANPVLVRTYIEDGFAIRAEPILKAFSPRTRAIIINSPCNPTGALMTESELTRVCDEAVRVGAWVILDLCYERLIFDDVAHNLPAVVASRMRDRAVLAGSASKSYAMTGWRCGWAIGPAPLIAACNAVQSHSTSNACSISQRAAAAALTGSQRVVTEMLEEYRRRRDALLEILATDPRLRISVPAGAFYLFVDVSELLSPSGLRTSADFAQGLLDHARVALTAGEAFDAPGFIRISFATSMAQIREGATRILEFIGAHKHQLAREASV
jgi:aspartate aminotransferase